MTNFDTGRKAETVAMQFLMQRGCKIIARNWRTRRCEIDIIAKRAQIIYLCEVKYRIRNLQGSGIEYITPKKLSQMRFAAELWAAKAAWTGDYQLCAIEVSGPEFKITNVVKDI